MTDPSVPGSSVPDEGIRDAWFRGYYETARTPLLDLLDAPPVSVLEIGCGGGANLGELKRRHPACRTVGVELRADAAAVALRHHAIDEVRTGNILDAGAIDFPAASFDLIVMSHVLEHFAEPEQVIERALQWLQPNGQMLVALPNVRHVSVLVDLLWRRDFPYRDAGILDRTHLRFFTCKSAVRFLQGSGLHIEKLAPDIGGEKSKWMNRLSLGLTSDLAAFAYNFLLRRR